MLVLKILGGLLVLALVLFLLVRFDVHCSEKFGYRFFKFSAFIILTISGVVMVLGRMWYKSSLDNGSDTLNGLVIMIIGGLILLGVVVNNLKETGLVYGLLGSTIQISLFCPLGLISMPFLVVLGFASPILSKIQPVYVLNK